MLRAKRFILSSADSCLMFEGFRWRAVCDAGQNSTALKSVVNAKVLIRQTEIGSFADSFFYQIAANFINLQNGFCEFPLKPLWCRPSCVAGNRHPVPVKCEVSPNHIFSGFFRAQMKFIKERNDNFNEVFRFFHSPITRRIGFAFIANRHANPPAKIFMNKTEDIRVVLSELDLNAEPIFRHHTADCFSPSVPAHKRTFPIKKSRKIISEFIYNRKTIGYPLPQKAVAKCSVNIHMIEHSVPLFKRAESNPRYFAHFPVRKPLTQEANFSCGSWCFKKITGIFAIAHNSAFHQSCTTGERMLQEKNTHSRRNLALA